ncbi:class I SAM-dependent methyltransferase [Candidatus Falkowbacteria bacterium]|nr:class I SAM-dependent methyltransferase [Candidatus Falkowbacteria bacterium]
MLIFLIDMYNVKKTKTTEQGGNKVNYLYRKLVQIGEDETKAQGISLEDLCRYFPRHLQVDVNFKSGLLKFKFMEFVLFLLATAVKTFLLPRKEQPGYLDIEEVDRVYDREARLYDWKHHLTTRGMDTVWRRQAGYTVATYCQNNNPEQVKVLDICTGTGLTIWEIAKILADRNINARLTGLDYNKNMLAVARKRRFPYAGIQVEFIKGNAMELYLDEGQSNDEQDNLRFDEDCFDCATQMCGIGGIRRPKSVFEGVLKVLKPGGYYYLADMHRPIICMTGEVPILHKWMRMPLFEALAYESTTIPLVLNRLWGWRDTTLDFYILPLITCFDGKHYWGFETLSFETESQRWWFSLPVMPYAKLVVKKIEITQEDYQMRQKLLSLLG